MHNTSNVTNKNTEPKSSYKYMSSSFPHTVAGMRVVCEIQSLSLASQDGNLPSTSPSVVTIMPAYDVSTLHMNPIFQSPQGAHIEHPSLFQPRHIDYLGLSKDFDDLKHPSHATVVTALKRLNLFLKYPNLRQDFESAEFDVVTIEEKHLSFIPKADREKNTTIGIRGVVAKNTMGIGTPLIYCAQYLTEEEWNHSISELAQYLEDKLKITNKKALYDAGRRLMGYAGRPTMFASTKYYTPAYGAGNITVLINHDDKYHNLQPIYIPYLDINGERTSGSWVFYSTREIKKGEQLLINYGENYNFEPFEMKRIQA